MRLKSALILTVVVVPIFALGCTQPSNPGTQPQTSSSAPAPAPAAVTAASFGAPITSRQAMNVADLARDPPAWQGKPIVISGTVTDVCPNMGCWMVIEDGGQRVRVRMNGHAFFVPKDSKGKRALVQGQLQGSDAAPHAHDCQHEKKPGEKHDCPKDQPGELAFNATGVELI